MADISQVLSKTVPDTAIVRAILKNTRSKVKGDFGFITSVLRYNFTLSNGKVDVVTFVGHREPNPGYDDDDDQRSGLQRLGGTNFLGEPELKTKFETLLRRWFEYDFLGLTRRKLKDRKSLSEKFKLPPSDRKRPERGSVINAVLQELIPEDILGNLSRLSMKADIYTNRTLLGWHKDWNAGHALVLGLLNVSEGELSSTELFFLPGDDSESSFIAGKRIRESSTTRTAIREAIPELLKLKKNIFVDYRKVQSGGMTWFNDVVWVHRTPPMGRFDEATRDNMQGFFINGPGNLLPKWVIDKHHANRNRYLTADTGDRMLVRVTIRDQYQK